MFSKSNDYTKNGIHAGFCIIAFFSSISISLSQIGLGIVLLFWFILILKHGKIIFPKTPLNIPVLIYIASMLISSLFGVNFLNSLISIKDIWLCLTFFSMMTFIDDIKTIKRLIFLMFAGAAIAAIYGIVQHLIGGLDIFRPDGSKIIQYAYLQIPNEVISIGFFNHHLTFAEVILYALCLSTAFQIWNWHPVEHNNINFNIYIQRGIYLSLNLLLSIALLFSYARGSWIGFIMAFFFLLILTKKKKSLLIGLTFILILGAIMIFHQPTRGRITSIFDQVERLYIWKIAIELIKENPLTGVGPNNWEKAVQPKIRHLKENNIFTFGDMGVTQHAHNNFLTQFAENGIIGLSAFIYIFYVIYKEGLKIYTKIPEENKWQRGLVIGGLAGITAFHGAGIFENTFGDSEVVMLMWFITALILKDFSECKKIHFKEEANG